MKNINRFVYTLLFVLCLLGCSKKEFLDQKPNDSMVVPKTLEDFQAILDNDVFLNGAGAIGVLPSLGEVGADNYYVFDANYNTTYAPLYKNSYIWAQDVYNGETILDWDLTYKAVFYANVVLDGLVKLEVPSDKQIAYNNVKGSALFYRAFMFYNIAQVFAPHYVSSSANTDLGIPLRLTADVNEKVTRSTLQQTYDRIINDLKESIDLMPTTPLYLSRPSKTAAHAMLARVYQTMQDYGNAMLYANSCLQLKSTLQDYNDGTKVTPLTTFSFKRNLNDDVIFHCNILGGIQPIRPAQSKLDSNLYNSYNLNDLRRSCFFKNSGGGITFTGSYDGSILLWGGLATDEVYLIRAEMNARAGNTSAAMADLNTLLVKRWKTGFFTPLTAATSADALQQVLTERRKELCFRGLRWTDLRRLNKEGANITLTRKINGQLYTLPPNDLRYVYPIPDDVMSFNPTMPQNPR